METIHLRAAGDGQMDQELLLSIKSSDSRLLDGKTSEEISKEDAQWLLNFILGLPYVTVKELVELIRADHSNVLNL